MVKLFYSISFKLFLEKSNFKPYSDLKSNYFPKQICLKNKMTYNIFYNNYLIKNIDKCWNVSFSI